MRRGCAEPSLLLLFLAVLLAWAEPALADAPIEIGRTIFVANDVQGRLGEEQPKRVVVNDDVLYQEYILTADQAETIMEFRDGSTFEVGPGAVVRIDSFVFNPDEGIGHKAVSVGRGVFRYVSGLTAKEQDTRISTGNGVLAIRGSVVAGIVDPDVPDFVYVGEGSAVFTNDAGSTGLQPGQAVAVPSRTTTVMRSETMPPAVAAQALQAIERRLPQRDVLRNRPPPSEAWLKRAGAANLLPVAEQQRQMAPPSPSALSAIAARSSIASELGLLVEGHRRGLFDGAQSKRTPEQQAFIAAATRQIPAAPMLIARTTTQSGALHRSSSLAAARVVMSGVAAAAPSPDVANRVATNAVRVNPAAVSVIRQTMPAAFQTPHAGEAVPPDRARTGEKKLSAKIGSVAPPPPTRPVPHIPESRPSPAPGGQASASRRAKPPEPARAAAQRPRAPQSRPAAMPVRQITRAPIAKIPARKLPVRDRRQGAASAPSR